MDLRGRVQAKHPRLELDLRLGPLLGPVDWASIRALPEARPSTTLNHYQYGVAVNGTVAIDGIETEFAGTA